MSSQTTACNERSKFNQTASNQMHAKKGETKNSEPLLSSIKEVNLIKQKTSNLCWQQSKMHAKKGEMWLKQKLSKNVSPMPQNVSPQKKESANKNFSSDGKL